ncbi:MAG TPA: ABC transporter permease, partial [Bacteroidia bacterium]
NTQYMMIGLLEAPVLAFVLAYLVRYFNTDDEDNVGYVFNQNENMPAYMFMSVVVALFIGLTVSAEEIIKDRKILKRESFLNLSRFSYLVSKIGIMFTLSAVQTILYVLVGNYVMGIKGMWGDYWLVLFTTSCFANMLGLNISASFNSAVTIYILIPFLIIPQLLLSGVIVKFDKLNPVFATQGSVPLVGEMMTSRWAYEALAVNQFKNNASFKPFYKFEKAISEANYKRNYWKDEIEKKLSKIEKEIDDATKKKELEADVLLVKNEIEKEGKLHPKLKYKYLDKITNSITKGEVNSIKNYLNSTYKDYYLAVDKKARKAKDELSLKLNSTPEKKEEFIKKQQDYQNEALEQALKNKNDLGPACLEKDGQLIQRTDPVYLYPTNNYGGAHFYAPKKKLFGKYFETFWFNISVIWLMSITLMITLYFDVLKRLLDLLGSLTEKLPFKKKKR